MSQASVRSLSYKLAQPGQINSPGITYQSREAVQSLLLTDAEKHHCFFRSSGFHNHLSHHLLAVYDLGATASHLKRIYEEESKVQRPIILEEEHANIVVTSDNWVQYLGNQSAYYAFLQFFSAKIEEHGAADVLEKYVFEESANTDEKRMLIRLMSGLVHPFIQVGHGLEFGNDTLVATGLAQTAVHSATTPDAYKFEYNQTHGSTEKKSLSFLEIIRQVYDSELLHPPMPYDPNALYSARLKHLITNERLAELDKICSKFFVADPTSQTELDGKVQELIWASVLLLFSTGRPGHKPRLDFFLMHLVTSSIWLRPFFRILKNPVSRANLLRAFVPTFIIAVLARGRPRINANLLMSATATPRPPSSQAPLFTPGKSAMGSPLDDSEYNPWPVILNDILYHPEAHVVKTLRTLIFASQKYGTTAAGEAIGTYDEAGQPTHAGIETVDGTIFVRAAGMLMDYMGWVTHGQEARPDWDRSAHGWDAAWDIEVD